MKLKNILIVVNDLERSKAFYKELFGLQVVLETDGNVTLTEGLVLQEKALWKIAFGKEILSRNHATLLYFEERNFDSFVQKLEACEFPIEYATPPMEFDWGTKMLRIYDLDGNLIEVRSTL